MRGKGRDRGPSLPVLSIDHAEPEWGSDERRSWRREGVFATFLRASARALEAEEDRWFLWLPVLFAGGILAYFALADEPGPRPRPGRHGASVGHGPGRRF
jgi:hypothetical protein